MRNSTMSLSKKGNQHNCSLRIKKHQRTWDKLIILMKKFLLPAQSFFHTNMYGETRVRTTFKFVSKTEIKSRPGKQANQDSPWKTKRANSCWSQIWDPEARTWSRVWQKKYPGIKWKYSFSANEHWSYYYKMWAIHARSISTRRNIRTTSGSSWNLYQEYARHWRIAEKSRVKGRGGFKRKIDWRLWGSDFILPGLECQDSLHPWRQRREADAEIDDEHTRNSLASPLYLQEREASASLLQVHYSQKRKLVSRCTVNFSKYVATRRLDVDQKSTNLIKSSTLVRSGSFFGKTREQLLAKAKSEILRHEYRADLAENNICELERQIDSQAVEMGHTRTGYEQSRREQALLHEELADRERALRDTRIGSI